MYSVTFNITVHIILLCSVLYFYSTAIIKIIINIIINILLLYIQYITYYLICISLSIQTGFVSLFTGQLQRSGIQMAVACTFPTDVSSSTPHRRRRRVHYGTTGREREKPAARCNRSNFNPLCCISFYKNMRGLSAVETGPTCCKLIIS